MGGGGGGGATLRPMELRPPDLPPLPPSVTVGYHYLQVSCLSALNKREVVLDIDDN